MSGFFFQMMVKWEFLGFVPGTQAVPVPGQERVIRSLPLPITTWPWKGTICNSCRRCETRILLAMSPYEPIPPIPIKSSTNMSYIINWWSTQLVSCSLHQGFGVFELVSRVGWLCFPLLRRLQQPTNRAMKWQRNAWVISIRSRWGPKARFWALFFSLKHDHYCW